MDAAAADLLCTEEELEEEVVETVSPAVPTIDAGEALSMLLEQEARKERVARNPSYLAAVQRHGMRANWRQLICKWMFEVCGATSESLRGGDERRGG